MPSTGVRRSKPVKGGKNQQFFPDSALRDGAEGIKFPVQA